MSKGGARDYYLPKSWFRSLVGFTETEFDLIVSDEPLCQASEDGYPVFAFMKYLYARWREAIGKGTDRAQPYKKRILTEDEIAEEVQDKEVKRKINQQKYLTAVLSNEMKAALLMPKQLGEQRSVKLLTSVSGMIEKVIIPNAAEELASEEIEGKVRLVTEILVRHFRKAVDELKQKTINTSWGEDGEANLLKARLARLADDDPEFVEIYQGLYNEE